MEKKEAVAILPCPSPNPHVTLLTSRMCSSHADACELVDLKKKRLKFDFLVARHLKKGETLWASLTLRQMSNVWPSGHTAWTCNNLIAFEINIYYWYFCVHFFKTIWKWYKALCKSILFLFYNKYAQVVFASMWLVKVFVQTVCDETAEYFPAISSHIFFNHLKEIDHWGWSIATSSMLCDWNEFAVVRTLVIVLLYLDTDWLCLAIIG